jgi:lysine-N-methylase
MSAKLGDLSQISSAGESMPCLELEAPPASRYARPNYAERFRCITSACEDTCCSGWTIPIDRRTVEAYRKHQVLQPFSALLVLNEETPSSGDYARMPLTHSGTCAFLSPDKLCGIHRHLGESVLSVACKTFPRETSHHLGEPETALNLSCPEAARLTLLDPELLEAWRPEGPNRYARVCNDRVEFDPVLAVREFLLLLLTDRRHTLAQRLRLMGEVAARIDSHAWTQNHLAETALLLRQFAAIADSPSRNREPGLALEFAAWILDERLAQPPVPQRFLECVEDFHAGLAFAKAHAGARNLYFEPFLQRHPHLLENYVANHMFKYSYPFGRNPGDSPAEAHLYLSALASVVETMLFASACHHRESFNEADAVKRIQSISKAIEHRGESRLRLVERMRSLETGKESILGGVE